MGHYKHNGDGDLSLISGRGRAEYGASTIRTGRVEFDVTADTNVTQAVTFNEPMPDADYLVDISSISHHSFWTISGKTANGFNLHVQSTITSSSYGVTYTAFKLYTDTEYNEVLERVEADAFGTAVDFSSYSSSSPYTCPSDGYAIITSPTGVNKQSTLYVDGAYFGLVETVRAGYPTVHSVFVKKGFRIYGGQTAGATDGNFKFLPLV